MRLEDVFAELGLETSCLPTVSANWERSVASCPAGIPVFLQPGFCRQYYPLTKGPGSVLAPLVEAAAVISRSTAGRLLAWHAHRTLCEYDREKSRFREWPEFSACLGDNAGLFYLLIALSCIPEWERAFRQAGIPEQHAHDCAPWLAGAIGIYGAAHGGRPGLNHRQLYWTGWYMTNTLFRLGRFEYMNQEIGTSFPTVYRQRASGRILALCNNGWLLDQDGLCLFSDQTAAEARLVTALQDDGATVTGVPISPCGRALPERPVRLPLSEWERVLGPGDFAPGIHIPGGGRMTLAAAGESLHLAAEFYRQYFPEKQVKAFVCASWIFNPDLEAALPESNLTVFMRQLYLFPWRSGGRDGLFFIFGRDDGDLKDYPRDNSVRRALLDILASGRRLRCGGMFILPQHLEHFGQEYYRVASTPPVAAR